MSNSHPFMKYNAMCDRKFLSKIPPSFNFKEFILDHLIRSASILWSLQLYLEPLHPNLKAIHRLNGSLCARLVVKTHEPEAFALVCGAVNEDLAADDIAEGEKHLHQLCVSELLW